LKLDGTETFDLTGIAGGIKPQMDVACRITRANGKVDEIKLLCRIDTLDEVEYYRHGGILQYVLRQLAARDPCDPFGRARVAEGGLVGYSRNAILRWLVGRAPEPDGTSGARPAGCRCSRSIVRILDVMREHGPQMLREPHVRHLQGRLWRSALRAGTALRAPSMSRPAVGV